MLNAGDIRENDRFAEVIFGQLEALTQDWALRKRMAERMQAIVDGNGAIRLAKVILKFVEG